jgi:hypothetical protein
VVVSDFVDRGEKEMEGGFAIWSGGRGGERERIIQLQCNYYAGD